MSAARETDLHETGFDETGFDETGFDETGLHETESAALPVMPDLPHPVRVRARHVPKPWGGRRMATVLGRELPGSGPIGESWLVHDREGTSSVVVDGPLAGTPVHELRGEDRFPLLVKILDASQPLSVQVHPGTEAAARLGAEAKTEAWFVLHAEPDARVYRGLKDGATEADVRSAAADGSFADLLHAIPVGAGDTVYVPAGSVHTIGEGVLLFEVQQNSDTTYRLHDWGRVGLDGEPRRLHVEEALSCIDFGPRPEDVVPPQLVVDEGPVRRLLLLRSPHFTVEHLTAMGTFTLEAPASPDGTWRVLHVLSGRGTLRAFDRTTPAQPFEPGDTLLLPHRFEEYEVELGASVLRGMLVAR